MSQPLGNFRTQGQACLHECCWNRSALGIIHTEPWTLKLLFLHTLEANKLRQKPAIRSFTCSLIYKTAFRRHGSCTWEMVECGAGAPELSGATLPQGMTGPALLRQQMDAAVSHNLTVMRFWVPGVSPSYALQTSPGVYNEGMLKGAVGQQFPAAYLLNLGWHCNLTCDVTVAPGPLLTTAWTYMAAGHVCSYRYGHWASGLHLTLTETIIRPS